MRTETIIRESAIDADFEYNFDVTPFNHIIDGLHWLAVTPYRSAAHLVKVISGRRRETGRQSVSQHPYSGPYCLLK